MSDTGPGIAEDLQPEDVGRFVRADRADRARSRSAGRRRDGSSAAGRATGAAEHEHGRRMRAA
ncbi:hypothetical protein ACFPC0_19650 [Streptomyces andamanensis]|uniref:Uncharacterized protein n=1 Tax=Streptomyces andamanensis TaxID=1565035 RepID=A0ABV8TH60_9ACTN